jgi:hypothetical protein
MVIYTTSIVAQALLFMACIVGAYLLLTLPRLLLGQSLAARDSALFHALQQIVDPVPRCVERWLLSWRRRPSPPWVSWAIVIVGAVIVRHVLLCVVIEIVQVSKEGV